MDSQNTLPRNFSCEFFPPKTEKGKSNLRAAIEDLAPLSPAFFSCTYGAGGTTQEGTYDTIKEINTKGYSAAPHITCIGSTKEKIKGLLNSYVDLGLKRLVALRGDLPEGVSQAGEFQYANELVSFIRKETGNQFQIEVAAYPEKHPQAKSVKEDLQNFKRKIDAGANAAITQYFFNADAYYRFVDDCESSGIKIAIVPGIMPITNFKQLVRFSEGCGAEVPRWIQMRLADYGDDLASIRAFGLDVVTALCGQLLDAGAPGLHFYTLNRSEATRELWRRLNLEALKG